MIHVDPKSFWRWGLRGQSHEECVVKVVWLSQKSKVSLGVRYAHLTASPRWKAMYAYAFRFVSQLYQTKTELWLPNCAITQPYFIDWFKLMAVTVTPVGESEVSPLHPKTLPNAMLAFVPGFRLQKPFQQPDFGYSHDCFTGSTPLAECVLSTLVV